MKRLFFPLLIFFLPFLFFLPLLGGQYVIGVGDFSSSDLLDMHLPYKYFLHESYLRGEFPVWSQHLSGGFPFLAEGQSGPLYPLNILLAFVSPVLALNLSVLFAFSIAGLGFYLYSLVIWRGSRSGALVGAVSFMFCSFFVAHIKHLNMIAVAAYFPWAGYVIHRYAQEWRFRWIVLLSGVWSLQLLAGHPHMAYVCILLSCYLYAGECFYSLYSTEKFVYGRVAISAFCSRLGWLLFALFLAFCLAAPQVLPTVELSLRSSRFNSSFRYSSNGSFYLPFLGTFIYPYIFGNPAAGTYLNGNARNRIWWENVLYVGLVPLGILLVFISQKVVSFSFLKITPYLSRLDFLRSYRRFFIFCLFIGSLLFFSLAMGQYSLSYLVAWYVLPGFSLFRFPSRFNFFVLFSFCMVTVLYFPIVITRIAHFFQKKSLSFLTERFISFLLMSVVVANAYLFVFSAVVFYPASGFISTPHIAQQILSDGPMQRVLPVLQYEKFPYFDRGWRNTYPLIASFQEGIPDNYSLVYKTLSFNDRALFEGSLSIGEKISMDQLFTADGLSYDVAKWYRLLELWGVRYVVSLRDLPVSSFRVVEEVSMPSYYGRTLKLYRDDAALPRAYFTQNIVSKKTEKDVFQAIQEGKTSPYFAAYSVSGLPTNFSRDTASFNEHSFKEHQEVYPVLLENTRLSFTTNSVEDAYLVVSDTFYPGWRVSVDGILQKPIQVNILQRAVAVPSGRHTIVWYFVPYSFYIGFVLSSLGLFSIVVLFIIQRKRCW
jgi:hypothetical protein